MNQLKNFLHRPLILIPLLFLVFIISGYFLARGMILRKVISSASKRVERYGYSIQWDNPRFKGINGIFFRSINVKSTAGNDNIRADSLLVKVKVLPILLKKVNIRKLECESIDVRLARADSAVTPEVRSDSAGGSLSFANSDLAGTAYQYIRRFFNHVPAHVNIKRVQCSFLYLSDTSAIRLEGVRLGKRDFRFLLSAGKGSAPLTIMPVKGILDRQNSVIQVQITCRDTGLIPFPLLRDKYGFSAGFDSINFSIDLSQRNRHLVHIKGNTGISGLEINGERLSTGNIIIRNFASEYHVTIGPRYIEADSSTTVTLNRIGFNPFLKLSVESDPLITFKILPERWDADKFFTSLPPGMFTSLTGTRADGHLDFRVNFSANLNQPDSLIFDVKLKSDDFKVKSFGTDDYRLLNHSFNHKVYYKGNLIASFVVGPENPDFAPLETISPFLRYAVMTSEDGSFFFHKGFNPGAFRESIATNIKERRFARGGSTISMQLVKNVFLTRNKTVARKIEEALIVWIIENQNLVSKQRMYEVYLNIIEWGPGIYGVTNASEYYFGKKPADLTLNESIFMASIAPRPKWFRYTFESNGNPRPFFSVYFGRVKELMVRKQFIPATDTTGVSSSVTLTGPAASLLDSAELKKTIPGFIPLEPIRIREIRID